MCSSCHSLLAFTVASFIQVHFRNNSPFLESALIISCSVHVHAYKWIIFFPVISLLVYKNTAIGWGAMIITPGIKKKCIFSDIRFRWTSVYCLLQIRDMGQEPCGRLSFLREPKTTKGLPQTAICNLNITLPTHKKVRFPWLNCWFF